MRIRFTLAIAGLLFSGAALAAEQSLTPAAQAATATVDDLAWMAGCWANDDGAGNSSEECWLHPAGGMMLGINRAIRGDRTQFEFLRLALHKGTVAFLASPSGRAPAVPFTLVEIAPNRAVFANPEHDFPQRLTYTLGDDGNLRARVEAQRDGEWGGFELVWSPSALTR